MRVGLEWGGQRLDLEVADERLVPLHASAFGSPVTDAALAVRQALDNPVGFPPLRQAIIPDDRIAIVVDESLGQVPTLLVPILGYLCEAGIAPQAITLVCAPPSTDQPWLEDLPDAFQDIHVEIHDPSDRKRLSYLSTTRHGRRLYLNRTVVDAEQTVVLTRLGYDCRLGYAGGEGSLFPVLSDEATRQEAAPQLSFEAPGPQLWRLRQEAREVAWHLGAPFLVQVVEGAGDAIAGVLAGTSDSSPAGQQMLDARWRVQIDRPPDVVVGAIGHARPSFAEIARAFACGARVVRPNGQVVVLTDADPELGPSAQILRSTEDSGLTLRNLAQEQPADHEAGFLWAQALQRAHLYLLSKVATDVAEELHVTPLENAGQVQRLLGRDASCLIIPDAHNTMAILRD